jgi:hypothetical protein
MGLAAKTPELDRIERDVSEAERADRIEQRYRVTAPANWAEADRLAEAASQAFAEQYRLGEICFSLQRCRERATDHGYSDVVLAVQPLVDKYNDLLRVARDAYADAVSASAAFNVREWRNAD